MAALQERRLSVKERIAAVEQKARKSDEATFLQQFTTDNNQGAATLSRSDTSRSFRPASASPRRRVAKMLPRSVLGVDCAKIEQSEKAHKVVKKQALREIARINLLLEANSEALQRNSSPVLERTEQQQKRVDDLRAEQMEMRRDVRMQIERQVNSARERIAILEEETQTISEALLEIVECDEEETAEVETRE